MRKRGFYEKYVKRLFDFILSLLLIIFFLPLFIFLSITIRVKLGPPVIFIQERPGKDEIIFRLYKFRTMSFEKDKNGILLPDAKRLTKFGKFLRSSSLDELPELFNILKGDMSLVGPRPLAVKYLPFYLESERKRHYVRPGLTGYSQVNGRNSGTWENRFDNDIFYINNLSLLLDIKIFFKTIFVVFRRKNIGTRGIDSLPDFDIYRSQQRS